MKTVYAVILFISLSAKIFAQASQLDYSFGENGIVTTYLSFTNGCYAQRVELQPDGKILLGGFADVPGPLNYGWGIVRYNSDGSLDTSFANNGEYVTGYLDEGMNSMSLLKNGKIAIGEWQSYHYYLIVLNPDGSFVFSSPIPDDFSPGYDMASQSDGKIIIAGAIPDGTNYDFALARYNSTGGLDSSFGLGETTYTKIDSNSFATTAVILPSDKILVGGDTWTQSDQSLVIAQYFPNGTPDSSFGINGVVITDIDSSLARLTSLSLLSDSLIQAVALFYNDNVYEGVAVVRYKMDGNLDSTFFDNGKLIIRFDTLYFPISSIAIQSNLKVVVAGTIGEYTDADFALVRYNVDGSLDSTLGGAGLITADLSSNLDNAYDVILQPDGKILEAGLASIEFGLVRFLPSLNIGIAHFTSLQYSPLIFPNPIKEIETFQYTLEKSEVLTLRLYDLDGRLMKTFFTNEARVAGEHREELHFGNLTAGNYLLSLSNGKQQVSVKIVKR